MQKYEEIGSLDLNNLTSRIEQIMFKEINLLRITLLSLILSSWLLPVTCHAYTRLGTSKFNLNFESFNTDNYYKDSWQLSGDFDKTYIENEAPLFGKYSLKLSTLNSKTNAPQAFISQTIYSSFSEEFITLEGYVKYNNIDNSGFFNIYLTTFDGTETKTEIFGESKFAQLTLSTTARWKKFSLTLPISKDVIYINIGGALLGKGVVWLDNLDIIVSTQGSTLEENNMQTLITHNQAIDDSKFIQPKYNSLK